MIEDINILQLMKDIKNMISTEKTEFINSNYKIKLYKSENISSLEPIIKLLNEMVKENYLITGLYFESKLEFEKCFGFSYDERINRIFNSIRIDEIRFEGEETYSGTFIYSETYGDKLRLELACAKYLAKFQKERIWHI